MAQRRLQAGDPAPDFYLETSAGIEVVLTACLLEGPVLIEFIRGTWDPDARARLGRLAEVRERFRALQSRILTIACERAPQIAHYLERHPSPLTILADETRRVARAYGVLQRFSLPVWNVARPASFLVDRCGFIRHAWVARLPIHAADLEEVLRVLEEVESEPRH